MYFLLQIAADHDFHTFLIDTIYRVSRHKVKKRLCWAKTRQKFVAPSIDWSDPRNLFISSEEEFRACWNMQRYRCGIGWKMLIKYSEHADDSIGEGWSVPVVTQSLNIESEHEHWPICLETMFSWRSKVGNYQWWIVLGPISWSLRARVIQSGKHHSLNIFIGQQIQQLGDLW